MKNLISVILMVFLPLTLASDTQLRFQVYVEVEGDNETITGILTSHLKRELRALGDVDIVGYDDDWWHAIRVHYVEHVTKGGVKTGGLSIASIREIRLGKPHFKDGKFHFKDDSRNIKAVLFPSPLAVAVWPKDNLQEWCISITGHFNDDSLEYLRSTWRKIKE